MLIDNHSPGTAWPDRAADSGVATVDGTLSVVTPGSTPRTGERS
jgi:hypothetical protein